MDDTIPAVMPNDMSSKESRQNWARLIQKIYEVDPLVCPKCQGSMKIIAVIEELDIIEKILRHLDLWDVRNHDPPQRVSDYILLTVSDDGMGMDAETKQNIFKPLFTTKEPGKVTGLGLSTLYQIVKQHRGHINVNSETGAGTTFKIYLPALEAGIEDRKKKCEGRAIDTTLGTILVVEDDSMLRQALSEMLQTQGHKIIQAVDGDDAA